MPQTAPYFDFREISTTWMELIGLSYSRLVELDDAADVIAHIDAVLKQLTSLNQ